MNKSSSTASPARAAAHESTDSLDIFFREAAGEYTGPMDRSEEARLACLAQGGCEKSLDRLVRANSRFVIAVAKKYQNHGLPLKDLIQEGNIGMIRGIRKFDPARGVKLISYAVWWIRQAIQEAIAEQGRNVRIGRNSDAALSRLRRARGRLAARLGRAPTEQELATETEMEPDQVRRLSAMILPEIRLDRPVYDSEGPTHGERLGADDGPDAVELLHEAEDRGTGQSSAAQTKASRRESRPPVFRHRGRTRTYAAGNWRNDRPHPRTSAADSRPGAQADVRRPSALPSFRGARATTRGPAQ
jgi:RNA polymerase sigma factor (sigma-70 family)